MNIVLFEESDLGRELPLRDERAAHVLKVLRRGVGDEFDAGLIDGARGKATIKKILDTGLVMDFEWGDAKPELLPIDLVVGLSRPQTMRKILNEATTLGVRSIRFVATERGEPSYAESKLWSTGEWRRHVLAGVTQAFTTRVPLVSWGMAMKDVLDELGNVDSRKLCLDNYEGVKRLGKVLGGTRFSAVALAIGSERGWTGWERDLFREMDWTLVGMGERVMRTETAVVAAVSVARELMG
ncbi:RsmE family RNA methyltransferase [Pelagicoccus sp. SDUM812002]|uniref:16S rRNA (uracil(1498)-N(3))-methyltransferase n=1 Tax=Pelagicoccus sp. SDUM812002 TaxID=3041266 RepID=UPI00280EA40C|nr:RsmE family RNA methyltransferase [Pelagicoccus sp. SDUM812002]MDQ8184964.1 RsmE family RNA methyltransferase [Pelagicoccus sp. SDUM812002]